LAEEPPAEADHDAPTPTVPEPALPPATGTAHLAVGPRMRPTARYGLSIQFEERPDDPELGRLVESTVRVNEAHPAYRRAAASRKRCDGARNGLAGCPFL
jgi:hypothetical protein